jgi:hypothetical protein
MVRVRPAGYEQSVLLRQMTVHRYLFRSMSRVVDFDAIQPDLRHYGDVFSGRRDGVDTL